MGEERSRDVSVQILTVSGVAWIPSPNFPLFPSEDRADGILLLHTCAPHDMRSCDCFLATRQNGGGCFSKEEDVWQMKWVVTEVTPSVRADLEKSQLWA